MLKNGDWGGIRWDLNIGGLISRDKTLWNIMDIIMYMVGISGVDGNGFKLVNIMKKRQKISLVLLISILCVIITIIYVILPFTAMTEDKIFSPILTGNNLTENYLI